LSTLEGIQVLVNDLRDREGQLDILVNNAGASWGKPLEEFPGAAGTL
jgi:2-deoxy-D-gluconate 3-dehydrogenase